MYNYQYSLAFDNCSSVYLSSIKINNTALGASFSNISSVSMSGYPSGHSSITLADNLNSAVTDMPTRGVAVDCNNVCNGSSNYLTIAGRVDWSSIEFPDPSTPDDVGYQLSRSSWSISNCTCQKLYRCVQAEQFSLFETVFQGSFAATCETGFYAYTGSIVRWSNYNNNSSSFINNAITKSSPAEGVVGNYQSYVKNIWS